MHVASSIRYPVPTTQMDTNSIVVYYLIRLTPPLSLSGPLWMLGNAVVILWHRLAMGGLLRGLAMSLNLYLLLFGLVKWLVGRSPPCLLLPETFAHVTWASHGP